MVGSEAPGFDVQAFDDSFFAEYASELAEVSVEEQASAALAAILTVQKADGSEKTYEELRQETTNFFAGDWVRNDEAIMNRMASEFAQNCLSHNHGAALAQDSQLGSIFERGMQGADEHGHTHDAHKTSETETDSDDDADPKASKKKKKRGWFGVER